MQRKPNIILGISPGTRSMGYAIMADGELVDWGVKYFQGKWTKAKAERIIRTIDKISKDYGITKISLKISKHTTSSKNLNKIYSKIKECTLSNGLTLEEFTIDDLKERCNKAKNLAEVRKFVIYRHPELGDMKSDKISIDYKRQMEAIAILT